MAVGEGGGGRGGWAAGGGAGGGEAEDVDCVCGGGDAEEGGGEVERHAVDGGGVGAAPELVQLVAARDGEDADDGPCLGGGGEARAVVVERDAGEGRAVRFDDVDVLERQRVEEEDLARDWGDEFGGWRGVRGALFAGLVARFGEGVGEETVVGGGGEGAEGVGVGRGRDGVEEVHVEDVVEVYFLLEYYHESLSV
ncbi:hypothetical protein V498_01285 [Pseudogymnoascus sp. VKM F-4517 (FW-2822)]|nr:hypothetical protein V498_01285 [Pseudogymnoascus sp. VKM F-4517 (FW-2822)]